MQDKVSSQPIIGNADSALSKPTPVRVKKKKEKEKRETGDGDRVMRDMQPKG